MGFPELSERRAKAEGSGVVRFCCEAGGTDHRDRRHASVCAAGHGPGRQREGEDLVGEEKSRRARGRQGGDPGIKQGHSDPDRGTDACSGDPWAFGLASAVWALVLVVGVLKGE